MAKGLAVGWDKEIGKVQRELTVTADNAYGFSGGKASGSTSQPNRIDAEAESSMANTYNDYRSMPITVNGIRELNEIVDWWENKQMRNRAFGAGIS